MAVTATPELAAAAPARSEHLAYGSRVGEFLLIGILVCASLVAVWLSWRWPLILDSPVFQYCAFLMDHGKVPYRDIVDMNGLGAYFSSWLEIHLFGYSDLAWRLYDLLFLLLGSVGIAFICKPYGRLATVMGSSLLILTHIRRGAGEIGERDFQMVTLVLLGAGFMLQGFRDGKRGWFLAGGATAFLGGAIKPTGFLFLAMLVAQAIVVSLRQKDTRLARPLWMVLGAAVPCLLAGAYLWWNGAWWPFVEVCRKLIPLYVSLRRKPPSELRFWLDANIEVFRLLAIPSGLLLVCKLQAWCTREFATVLLGVIGGFACYWIQAKAFLYHLDPLIAFLGVWCGLVIAVLIKDNRVLVRLPVTIALTFWILTWIPRLIYVPAAYTRAYPNSPELAGLHRLEAEISNLRAGGKDKGIQVMDISHGAVQALYELRLVQVSGFLYDFYFYKPNDRFALDLRTRFLRAMTAAQPDLLVVSQQSWPDSHVHYKRMDDWPQLRYFLASNYELKVELPEYRIYVHR